MYQMQARTSAWSCSEMPRRAMQRLMVMSLQKNALTLLRTQATISMTRLMRQVQTRVESMSRQKKQRVSQGFIGAMLPMQIWLTMFRAQYMVSKYWILKGQSSIDPGSAELLFSQVKVAVLAPYIPDDIISRSMKQNTGPMQLQHRNMITTMRSPKYSILRSRRNWKILRKARSSSYSCKNLTTTTALPKFTQQFWDMSTIRMAAIVSTSGKKCHRKQCRMTSARPMKSSPSSKQPQERVTKAFTQRMAISRTQTGTKAELATQAQKKFSPKKMVTGISARMQTRFTTTIMFHTMSAELYGLWMGKQRSSSPSRLLAPPPSSCSTARSWLPRPRSLRTGDRAEARRGRSVREPTLSLAVPVPQDSSDYLSPSDFIITAAFHAQFAMSITTTVISSCSLRRAPCGTLRSSSLPIPTRLATFWNAASNSDSAILPERPEFFRTKLATSSLESWSQSPSEARTTKRSPGALLKSKTSGQEVTQLPLKSLIAEPNPLLFGCPLGLLNSACLRWKSPRERVGWSLPFTQHTFSRLHTTISLSSGNICFSLSCSSSLPALWSLVICLRESTPMSRARLSPEFTVTTSSPRTAATRAQVPTLPVLPNPIQYVFFTIAKN